MSTPTVGSRICAAAEATIPPNTPVRMPRAANSEVTESGLPLTTRPQSDDAVIDVGSGHHSSAYKWII